ncbi:MAG TPA: hypothetical protein VJ715_10025, partial [Pyrinomonadaceae bacterium]|nr:hypothetical protein [Pyrinomonadaceae bacterium]
LPLFAQGETPRPDGWRGLVLDVNSPEEAIRLLGTPAKDKDKTALDMQRTLSWLSDKYKQKVFRTLTYKKLDIYKQVQLSFLDNKLVLINLEAPNAELEENWIDPDELESLFAVTFKPHYRKRGKKLPPPSEFQANAPTELKKDEYDYWYDMIAVTDNSFIVAITDNYKYISGLFASPDEKKRKEINARGSRYPGYVSHIEIISRSLASP